MRIAATSESVFVRFERGGRVSVFSQLPSGMCFPLAAPEAHWKLAGGGAQRNHRNRSPNESAPAGAAEISSTPAGMYSVFDWFRWLRSFLVSPPANFCCASGAFGSDERFGHPPESSANPAMEPAKYAKYTKGEALGLITRLTRQVNPGNIGAAQFRVLSRISRAAQFRF